MKSTSKIVMGATIVMVVIVALVLGILVILLAELYCSLFLRRHLRKNNSFSPHKSPLSSTPLQNGQFASPLSLSSFYAQGVLHAPRRMLFPPNSIARNVDLETQTTSQEIQEQVYASTHYEEHVMYISNPIYDDDKRSGNVVLSKVDTPFVTPDSSPSRLDEGIELCDKDDEEEEDDKETPPLTPMKKVPAEGCSVSLRDARSLCTTGSDSNSNVDCISTSSLGSPSTSPSW